MPRHRQPDNLLAFKGSKKRNPARYAPRAEPAASDALGEAPENFTPEERAAWALLAASAPEGTLFKRDEMALALAARLWASIAARPMAQVKPAETKNMHTLLKDLGLTPADASRIPSPPPPAEENPFAALQRKYSKTRPAPKKGW